MVGRSAGPSKVHDAVAFLRGQITSGAWPVNTRIPKEPELAEMLGVGMSTVREAVRSLSMQGMLEPLKGIGTFVRSRTPAASMLGDYLSAYSLEDLLVYRRALEVEAAERAAQHRTDAQLADLRASFEHDREAEPDRPRSIERGESPGPFHHLVFAASASSLLGALYASVMAAIRDARADGRVVFATGHEERHLDHGAILDAIEQRDAAAAARAMAQHVDRDLVVADRAPDPATVTAWA